MLNVTELNNNHTMHGVKILFHFCTVCEVQNADNTMTFKISPDDKVPEVYATTTSSVSAGDTVISNYCSPID